MEQHLQREHLHLIMGLAAATNVELWGDTARVSEKREVEGMNLIYLSWDDLVGDSIGGPVKKIEVSLPIVKGPILKDKW